MDHSTEHQQYQQYYQQYQSQAAEAYDPSQMQPFYAYNQQQYQYYTTTSYPQQFHQEPTSIHPPGVPIPPDPTHFQNQQGAYYSHRVMDNQSQQQSNLSKFSGNLDAAQRSTHPRIGQSAYRVGGRKGGRPFRGAARGHGPRPDGRGRGHSGGRHLQPHGAASNSVPSASVPGQTSLTVPAQVPAATWPPPRMAWCELCRVDCNTPEILEQHKNGKRHKKNLLNAESQNSNKLRTGQQNVRIANSGSQLDGNQPEKVERSDEKQPLQQSVPPQAISDNNSIETEQHKDVVEKPEIHAVDSSAEPQRKSRDQFDARGRGFKRKMRGGRGGKFMRTNEGLRRPVDPPKPKEVIPFICELCNVKCESQVVFDSHLAGKKHLANVKRFHGHRALYGEAAVQALYPSNFTAPSSSVIPQVQQAVSDPQVVLAQLLTYVLSQTQAPALLAAQVPGLLAAQVSGVAATMGPAPAPGSSQGTQYQHNISEMCSKDTVTVEAEGQQQSITTESEAPVAVSLDTKPDNGSEEKNSSLVGKNTVTAPSEKPVMNAEQVLSATASETAAPISKCGVALSDQAGNDPEDSVLEKEDQDPRLEIEEDPEEDLEEQGAK